MTHEASSFNLTHTCTVLKPLAYEAYPISCTEWDFLKKKMACLVGTINYFHTFGCLVMGVCLSVAVSLFLEPTIPQERPSLPTYTIARIAIVVSTLILGVLCFAMAGLRERMRRTSADDLLSQMEIIEQRFALPPSESASSSGANVELPRPEVGQG